MVAVPPEIAKAHFEQALTFLRERYEWGVQHGKWKEPTLKAEANYYNALQNVIANKTWTKGIQATSDEEWRNGCLIKGAPVIVERIREALDKWLNNWSPKYQRVLNILPTLPPRTLDYRANIQNRLVPVVEAWKGIR